MLFSRAMGVRGVRNTLLVTTLITSGTAFAQSQPYAPPAAPPTSSSEDANGVDLASGKLNVTVSSLRIGSGSEALEYQSSFNGTTLRNSIEGAIYTPNGTKYIVSANGKSFEFTKTGTTTFVEVGGNGHGGGMRDPDD